MDNRKLPNSKSISEVETTVCSTMHCYNRAEETNDPLHPPFCEQCQDRKQEKKVAENDE